MVVLRKGENLKSLINYTTLWKHSVRNAKEIVPELYENIAKQISSNANLSEQFVQLLKALGDINLEDAVSLIVQYLIIGPTCQTLFDQYPNVKNNPLSKVLKNVLSQIDRKQFEQHAMQFNYLHDLYKERIGKIDDIEPEIRLAEFHDAFFNNAYPRTLSKYGMAHTPLPIVDFIISSVSETLQDEFNKKIDDKGVDILDPFAGTGLFFVRLLKSGLIRPDNLTDKYLSEMHGHEIVPLDYHLSQLNIEDAMYKASGEYVHFPGMKLMDTLASKKDWSESSDIQLIIGNPPYSVGQKSEADMNENDKYPDLDRTIKSTYIAYSTSTNKRNFYDSYVRSIRWCTDHIKDKGIVALVTPSTWIDRVFADGMRHCISQDFSSIHVFHLRGDHRKSLMCGNLTGEGENVFGKANMCGVAIVMMVRNPDKTEDCKIFISDIGDNLNISQKMERIQSVGSFGGLAKNNEVQEVIPDKYNDWFNQRHDDFNDFIPIGDKRSHHDIIIFENYSAGVKTGRDAWCVNCSLTTLKNNIESSMDAFNDTCRLYQDTCKYARRFNHEAPNINDFVIKDAKVIHWSRELTTDLKRNKIMRPSDGEYVICLYRPFTKRWMYRNPRMNSGNYKMSQLFPAKDSENVLMAISGKGSRISFSTLMTDTFLNHDVMEKGQAFPIDYYEPSNQSIAINKSARSPFSTMMSNTYPDANLFDIFSQFAATENPENENMLIEHDKFDGITDTALKHFQDVYRNAITKEDIFYYIYGLFHSDEYRQRYQANLNKELPRIPLVKSFDDFMLFKNIGSKLGYLHMNYENIETPEKFIHECQEKNYPDNETDLYRVNKMKRIDDNAVQYNDYIRLENIPKKVWEYNVNGHPALWWVMNYQCIKTDKKTGIVNDANAYANQTMNNPKYPLDLFVKVAYVSVETVNIINDLPELVI